MAPGAGNKEPLAEKRGMRAIQPLGQTLGLSRLELAGASTSSRSSSGGCMAQGIGWLAGVGLTQSVAWLGQSECSAGGVE